MKEKTKINKSQFIRSRPNHTVQQIVEEADAAGISISQGLVWNVRSTDRAKRGETVEAQPTPAAAEAEAPKVAKKAGKKTSKKVIAKVIAKVAKKAGKKASKKVAKKVIAKVAKKVWKKTQDFNKSDFIRQHPNSSIQEIVAMAAKKGGVITPGLIYSIRSADRHKNGAKKIGKKAAKRAAKRVAPRQVFAGAAEIKNRVAVVLFDPNDPASVAGATQVIQQAVQA